MNIDPSTTKYLVRARLNADGIVEKPDVVGAIFGQTEGLLGDELDLRDLQKSGRIGRIEVDVHSKQGKSEGEILIPSSLDQVETVILASALETIDSTSRHASTAKNPNAPAASETRACTTISQMARTTLICSVPSRMVG